jgi:hypothetical protein
MAQEEFRYSTQSGDETLERLVAMTAQTNQVALDKTLSAIRRSQTAGSAAAAARLSSILERIMRAAYEVGQTIPVRKIATPFEAERAVF